MPNKPSWLLRVNDILADLSRPELTSLPSLSRAAMEKLFGLKRRQAVPREQSAFVAPSAVKIEGFRSTVALCPGELLIPFQGTDDEFWQLFQMAQAIKNDCEPFKALAAW